MNTIIASKEEDIFSNRDMEAKWDILKEAAAKDALDQAMRFNNGKLQWTLMDFPSFEPMIKVLMYGAHKYARDNWKKGSSKTEILDSLLRHVAELTQGNLMDDESKLEHIGHLMCNAMFYSYFIQHPEKARE